ncbi:MAG: endonuclease/exonuclease/phosphatase family protein [Bacteroidota bacterium]
MKAVVFLLFIGIAFTSCTPPQEKSATSSTSQVLSDSSVIAIPVGYEYPEGETLSVLSWNVEHFVDPFDDPYINNAREDNPSEQMEEKVNLFIAALKKANADVVVLQEFESEKYLMALARDSFPELGYQFFSDAASPGWYMNVILMSRFPIGELRAYGDVTTPVTGYRNDEGQKETQSMINTRMWTLQIFPAADYEFWLTGVHLKAGRGERNIAMRTGQITYLQRQFEQLIAINPSANLMMAGDFNAYPMSAELALLTSPLSGVEAMIDPLDTAVYTHPADEPVRRLDYMIYNQNMSNEVVPGSVDVAHLFSADSMRIISDHLPVMGSFYRRDQ